MFNVIRIPFIHPLSGVFISPASPSKGEAGRRTGEGSKAQRLPAGCLREWTIAGVREERFAFEPSSALPPCGGQAHRLPEREKGTSPAGADLAGRSIRGGLPSQQRIGVVHTRVSGGRKEPSGNSAANVPSRNCPDADPYVAESILDRIRHGVEQSVLAGGVIHAFDAAVSAGPHGPLSIVESVQFPGQGRIE